MKNIILSLLLMGFTTILTGMTHPVSPGSHPSKNPSLAPAGNWVPVGTEGFSDDISISSCFAFGPDGMPYVSYMEMKSPSFSASVKKFNGTDWVYVGARYFPPASVDNLTLAIDKDGEPCVAFSDWANLHKASAMKFDGTDWVILGNAGFSDGMAMFTSIACDPMGTPYVAFVDYSRAKKCTVMKLAGSTWENVGTPGFSTGEADGTVLAFSPSGEPYVAYSDITNISSSEVKIYVQKFDGTNWVNVGNNGVTDGSGDNLSLGFDFSGQPFVSFRDYEVSAKVSVRKFNGTTWQYAGMPGFSVGQGMWTSLAFNTEGQPYVSYTDHDNSSKATVMKFDGIDWLPVGNPGFSAGVAMPTSLAFGPSGKPYVAYCDTLLQYKTVLMYYPDDSTTCLIISGTIRDSAGNAISRHPVFISADPAVNAGFSFNHTALSDAYGRYADTVPLPAIVFGGMIRVKTFDCTGQRLIADLPYGPGTLNPVHDFTLCPGNPACQPEFVEYPDDFNPFICYFLDQSYGNPSYWHWQFGDGYTSDEQNPQHAYKEPGTYQACLVIMSADSSCSNVYCEDVNVMTVGCRAIFAHYPDSLHQNSIRFENHSVAMFPTYNWNFGDGTTSTVRDPVHSFPVPGNYQVCLEIYEYLSGCGNTYCNEVQVANTANCVSSFTYSASGYSVTLLGQLDNHLPATYEWEFGDGQTGSGSQIIHQYDSAGTYNIKLTTTTTGTGCVYWTEQPVSLSDTTPVSHLYGQVFAGGFPVNGGSVMVFSVDTLAPYLPFVDESPVDTNGIFYFIFIPDGDYYLHAIPPQSSGFLPTYYTSALDWQEATIVSLSKWDNPYEIQLVAADPLTSGPGTIDGHIVNENLRETIVDKIMMILSDTNGHNLTYFDVSEEGEFNFSSLAYGAYYLKAEIAGVNCAPILVIISATQPGATVSLTFTGNSITGIHDFSVILETVVIRPNPFTDRIDLTFSLNTGSTVRIELINSRGQLVLTKETEARKGINELAIRPPDLADGLYFVHISTANGMDVWKKVIRHFRSR